LLPAGNRLFVWRLPSFDVASGTAPAGHTRPSLAIEMGELRCRWIAKLAARSARADLAGLRSAEPLTLARSSRLLLVV